MCQEIDFRSQSYSRTMGQVLDLVGEPDIWAADLQQVPAVRSLAVNGRLDRLACLLSSAKAQAARMGFAAAVVALRVKESELEALRAEIRRHQLPAVKPAVQALGRGRKGRAAQIVAWIRGQGATAEMVMKYFQLARSTSQKYLRRARQETFRQAA